jgi:hypothetical protein
MLGKPGTEKSLQSLVLQSGRGNGCSALVPAPLGLYILSIDHIARPPGRRWRFFNWRFADVPVDREGLPVAVGANVFEGVGDLARLVSKWPERGSAAMGDASEE